MGSEYLILLQNPCIRKSIAATMSSRCNCRFVLELRRMLVGTAAMNCVVMTMLSPAISKQGLSVSTGFGVMDTGNRGTTILEFR